MKRYLLLFLICFIVLMFFSILILGAQDQVWAYGFSYNIAHGLIPYRDFNMVIGPLYSWLFAIPIIVFGDYLIFFKAFHVLLYSLIIAWAAYKIDKKMLLLLGIIAVQNTISFYNAFVAMLLIVIFILIDLKNKRKDLYIGLIIGIMAMIKHNLALPIFLVYFFTSKEKIKDTIYVAIPVFITFIYFLITNTLMDYIDICLLGMGNFADNLYIEPLSLILLIIVLVYMIIRYREKKDIILLYCMSFSIVIFPLIDGNHFLTLLIPLTYYVLTREKVKIVKQALASFVLIGLLSMLILALVKFEFVTDNNLFKYLVVEKGLSYSLKEYSKYYKNIEGNIYIFAPDAYTLKLYNKETTTFTDLINKGNLGRDETKYIKEIDKKCKKEKCTFILSSYFFDKKNDSQLIDAYKDYVIDNYEFKEIIPNKDYVYINYKEEKSE